MEELGVETLHGHKTGLWEVPYTGYIARLHRGEMILPRNVAEWFRRGGFTSKSVTIHAPVKIEVHGSVYGEDLENLSEEISRRIVRRLRVMS